MGFEALIRWHHPTRGIVPPNQFIPLAEESGLIMELGDWVIDEACRAAAAWPEHITVAVNISAKQLIFPALPNTVNEAIRKHRLQANRLELEVTESVFMGDSRQCARRAEAPARARRRHRARRFRHRLFLARLSEQGGLPQAEDRRQLRPRGGRQRETVAIIQSIVQLAKSFRMTVTAEGVETADDFTRMRDLGCHQIQGYLFGRPMSFERASELVHGVQQRLSA